MLAVFFFSALLSAAGFAKDLPNPGIYFNGANNLFNLTRSPLSRAQFKTKLRQLAKVNDQGSAYVESIFTKALAQAEFEHGQLQLFIRANSDPNNSALASYLSSLEELVDETMARAKSDYKNFREDEKLLNEAFTRLLQLVEQNKTDEAKMFIDANFKEWLRHAPPVSLLMSKENEWRNIDEVAHGSSEEPGIIPHWYYLQASESTSECNFFVDLSSGKPMNDKLQLRRDFRFISDVLAGRLTLACTAAASTQAPTFTRQNGQARLEYYYVDPSLGAASDIKKPDAFRRIVSRPLESNMISVIEAIRKQYSN